MNEFFGGTVAWLPLSRPASLTPNREYGFRNADKKQENHYIFSLFQDCNFSITMLPHYLALLCILVTFVSAKAEAQQLRYVVYADGRPCGVMELSIETLRNGYLEYRIRERRSIITADGKVEEYLRNTVCLADASLAPVSLESVLRVGGSTVVTNGNVIAGTMYLSTDFGKGRVERRREDCSNTIFDIMLPELAFRSLPDVPGKVFRLHDHRVVAAEISIEADGEDQLAVSLGRTEKWVLKRNGYLERYEAQALALRWERTTSPSLRPASCPLNAGLEWDAGAAALSTPPDNIRSLKATIVLSGQVGAVLSPEDGRQTVDPGSVTDGTSVSIHTRRRMLAADELELPIRERSLQQYSRPDSLVDYDTESVRARARELRSWERTAVQVISAISTMLRRDFVADAFIPLLPASSISIMPRGASMHAATLYVALARLTGIPARFVFGLAPVDGRWISRVWVEVWGGRWISIDPVRSVVVQEAAWIKLLDAASPDEILDQSSRLRGALSIRVEHIDVIDASEAQMLETAIIGSTYTNRKYKCAVSAPSDTWRIEERMLGDEIQVHLSPSAGSAIEFEVLMFANVYRQSAEQLLGARVRSLQALYDGLSLQQRGEVRIENRRVPTVMYSYTSRDASGASVRITAAHAMLAALGNCYLFTFRAPEDEFESIRRDMEHVLRTFTLYEQ
jgi:hypothetical protein